jgi:hypothetical protein
MNQLLPADMTDAQFRTMQAAVLEQEIAASTLLRAARLTVELTTGIRLPTRC